MAIFRLLRELSRPERQLQGLKWSWEGWEGWEGWVTKGVEMASVAKDGTTWSSWEDQS